jgi:hypothetical protein
MAVYRTAGYDVRVLFPVLSKPQPQTTMSNDTMPPDLSISTIKEVKPDADGSIVVTAEAMVGDQRTELEIAITRDLAPAMAIALLATTASVRSERDGLAPALDVLAAGVVPSSDEEKIRLQLLFDKGAVLPVELPLAAGEALKNGLEQEIGGSGPDGQVTPKQ